MTITVYGYVPAWGLPDISPYVTKLIFYLKICKIPFEYKSQDLSLLDEDAPCGKLPYIIDSDNGSKVADSNMIITYLQQKFGDADLAQVVDANIRIRSGGDVGHDTKVSWRGKIG